MADQQIENNTCSLCLNIDNTCVGVRKHHFQELNLLTGDKSLFICYRIAVCKNCRQMLEKCCNFKKTCLYVRDNHERLFSLSVNRHVACQYCGGVGQADMLISVDSELLRTELMTSKVFQYIDWDILAVADPVVCKMCFSFLPKYLRFFNKLLVIEEELKRYSIEGRKIYGKNLLADLQNRVKEVMHQNAEMYNPFLLCVRNNGVKCVEVFRNEGNSFNALVCNQDNMNYNNVSNRGIEELVDVKEENDPKDMKNGDMESCIVQPEIIILEGQYAIESSNSTVERSTETDQTTFKREEKGDFATNKYNVEENISNSVYDDKYIIDVKSKNDICDIKSEEKSIDAILTCMSENLFNIDVSSTAEDRHIKSDDVQAEDVKIEKREAEETGEVFDTIAETIESVVKKFSSQNEYNKDDVECNTSGETRKDVGHKECKYVILDMNRDVENYMERPEVYMEEESTKQSKFRKKDSIMPRKNSMKRSASPVHQKYYPKSVLRTKIKQITVSGAKTYQCALCQVTIKSKSSMNRHMRVHQNRSELATYQCYNCDFKTTSKPGLIGHLLSHRKDGFYECDRCGLKTNYKNSLRVHKKRCGQLSEYQCAHCSYTATHKSSLAAHLHRHTKELTDPVIECPKCPYTTRSKACLYSHSIIHMDPTETTMYKCPFCPYESKFKKSCVVHVEGHRTFAIKCKMCLYQTKFSRKLRNHMLKNHGCVI